MDTRQNRKRRFKQITEKLTLKYREIVESLLYLAEGTRPDISYAVNVLSRFQVAPTQEDWECVEKVLQYLRGTTKLGLRYTGETDGFEAQSDVSYCDWSYSTSTSGYLLKLFGDPVAWRSSTLTNVNSSIEQLAMSEICREIVSHDEVLRSMLGRTLYPVPVYCNYGAASENAQNEGRRRLCDFDDEVDVIIEKLKCRKTTGKISDISNPHSYATGLYGQGKIEVRPFNASSNLSNIFTKPLAYPEHRKFTEELFNFK